ncbi:MAG: PPC domain-containing protein [Anaerolineae bacterium]
MNATIGDPSLYTITIIDDDLPASGTATPVYTDAYEPNNTLQEAYTTSSGTQLCAITLWPTGDLDYFRFVGKKGSYYIVSTNDLDPGVDTALKVYNPQGNQIASNDDYEVGSRRSQVTIAANSDGYYYARIENRDPSDPANKTYCFEVSETTPPTPTPSNTPPPLGTDDQLCEFNSTIDHACTIGLDKIYNFNFVPVYGSLQDTDIFRIWMKPGIEYTCETTIPEGSLADTNMIFLDQNGNDFSPQLGNDDKEIGDLGSKLSYLSTYTGWLNIEVGPVNVPPFEEAEQYFYQLECTSTTATATPTATATSAFVGGGVPSVPTATPIVFPTFPPTPTPIDLSSFNTPPPPTPPVVQFQPLPTSTPPSGGAQTITINVTIYYDQNENFMPELTEGVVDTAVSLYENSTGELKMFGTTNEAGMIRFDSISVAGAVRVVVPFLNYTQIVTGESADILVRIAPQPLPVGIP